MRQGTTPAVPLTVDMDLIGWTVYVTFTNSGKELTITNDRLEMTLENGKTLVMVPLTQEETLAFNVGVCEVQIRAIHDGTAIATETEFIDIEKVLLKGVIHE